MDLRIEQQVQQWETMRGHLHQEDRAGKSLMIMLNDHQCVIDSETLFLNLDPEEYGYGVVNTCWKYVWKMLWSVGLTAQLCDRWTSR